MYSTDFVMFGLIDRNIALLDSFPYLLKTKNFHSLAPLLRIQLDSLLRLYAFQLVENQEELSQHILKGRSLRLFEDRHKKRLTDDRLVKSISKDLPWVRPVYEKLSGWVHFSGQHVYSIVSPAKTEGHIQVAIGSYRRPFPPEIFEECIQVAVEIHETIISMIRSYFASKNSSEQDFDKNK